jgi:predicted AAA+ superfamily ATPase
MKRYLEKPVKHDLKDKMVFVGGPRQVGKTTLALSLLKGGHEEHPAYLNWDFPETRDLLRRGHVPANEQLIILDEIHKYSQWRNLVKGLYDRYRKDRSFLITGSAKLDYYRRGGDSLQGRYYYYRLHPLSLPEITAYSSKADLGHLLRFGGFPEPFLRGDERYWRRWQRERQKRVIHEDLISLEKVRELSKLDLLVNALPVRVGSPLSVKALREDLEVAHQTVDAWLQILENLYMCFRINPFGGPQIRAVKKERKLYLCDWSLCTSEGMRFENMVACQLLKYCHFVEDTEGHEMELRFLRDTDLREVDFVVIKNKKPMFAVECKTGDSDVSKHVKYFSERLSIPTFYQVHRGKRDFENRRYRVRVLPYGRFTQTLGLP